MTIKTIATAAAIVAFSATSSMAGNLSDAGTDDDVVQELQKSQTDLGFSAPGSIDSMGGIAVPVLVGLLLFGALGSGGGS